MSGTAVDWDALDMKRPGIATPARRCEPRRACNCILQYSDGCHETCPRALAERCPVCGGYPHSAPPQEEPQPPRVVLDATREIYRALKIHHTTARMAALALYHAGLLRP